jgi:hypothetical protein
MQEHSESQFYSVQDVLAAAKVLLWQRQRSSVPKIKQLLRASMLQHGENDWTSIFAICFVRLRHYPFCCLNFITFAPSGILHRGRYEPCCRCSATPFNNRQVPVKKVIATQGFSKAQNS